ncbi:TPA: site-specific integrase [Streptococcus agalactiae]|uniref:tyrosine-type recombinase/integrase n=1 Tax=Streptococcus agalactiae TaxID=1311 RepID=UPI0002B95363|nr:site-specific integrase [Streptococcus agalactiae]EPV33398.1 integrase [Streptococcus agalactiae GB00679]EPX31800.1 integrase [Streptococcus agalactiae LMG 15092]MCC9682691.1 site-specific integrase [Streptococcus agalactiae]MCC9697344.1 site-specific integrase [Streptococcus agalactiae]MCC9920987.1 site-specific integrase [Streptococcus agalactiae]
MRDNGSRVLIISSWRPDPYKSGNVLVKFAMRFTHPITRKSHKKYLSTGASKGWFTTKATPSKKSPSGKERLLVSDIKNSQLITQVTQELNKLVDDYIAEATGVKPKKAKRLLTLEEVAKPFGEDGNLYGKAFKAWHERVKPANNTLKTRVTIYNRYIVPNFDTRMSITKFASMTDEIQKLINVSSMHMARNLHIYLKMVFDWSVENGQITLTQDPIANNKVKRRVLTKSEEQDRKREDIAEKYLEASEVNYVLHLIESWTNRPDNQLIADVLRMIFLTGMRPSEVLGLNEDMLNFEEKWIKVHWQRASKNKSDEVMEALNLNEKERYRADLKTKESVRTIPMSPEVEKILRHYIDRNKFQAQFNPTYQDLGYLFTRTYIRAGNRQGSPLYHNELSQFLRGGSSQSAKYNKKAGKPYKDIDSFLDFGRPIHVIPHMFRHSFISIMASEGIDLPTIREFVGHSEDSKEIERVYLHVIKKQKDTMRGAVEKLEKLIE